MPDQAGHTEALALRLPSGPPWEAPALLALCRALSGDPARADTANEGHLADFLPDTSTRTAYLADWERVLALSAEDLSTAQRWDQIRARLQGPPSPTRAYFEAVLRTLAGQPLLRLLQRLQPQFRAGVSAAGDAIAGDQWSATWWCEYMLNITSAAADDFGAWDLDTGVTVTPASFGSPVTGAATACLLTVPSGGFLEMPLPAAVDGSEVYASLFLRSASADTSVRVYFVDRGGSTSSADLPALDSWSKYAKTWDAGTGGATPVLGIENPTASTQTYYASWAVAGLRDRALETRIAALAFPINTTGVFGVINESGT